MNAKAAVQIANASSHSLAKQRKVSAPSARDAWLKLNECQPQSTNHFQAAFNDDLRQPENKIHNGAATARRQNNAFKLTALADYHVGKPPMLHCRQPEKTKPLGMPPNGFLLDKLTFSLPPPDTTPTPQSTAPPPQAPHPPHSPPPPPAAELR